MALGRFTAGWLLQIRQVRCLRREGETSLSLSPRGGEGVNVLQTRFVEVSTPWRYNDSIFPPATLYIAGLDLRVKI
ncbi:Uncharacterized protein DBV15_09258 [Temnothorax longispinosus]|uniref:Uncharacterized protein n=1 Tax=Temnothorax longispinosus TaxID=300112 RepID=A0A4S2KR90_9HYME|nr:Uncharacterized protein DBV15_09258 [Temnothorax longispinosus]